MKKDIVILILSLVILILIIALVFMCLELKNKTSQVVVSENVQTLDGPGMVKEYKDLSIDEWKDLISTFYNKNYGYIPDSITCEETYPNTIFVTIYHNTEFVAEYDLNTETGVASSPVEKAANFITGEFVENLSTKVEFENDECLAVGYIATGKEKLMKERYFNNEEEYSYLTTVSTGSDMCQFLVIPKKIDATIRIWKYNLSEEGELYFEELLTVAKGTPLLIKTESTEILPMVGIEYMCEDVSFTMPLQFSGMDGKLIFNENEDLIKNISIY